jgi:hypothetical protein
MRPLLQLTGTIGLCLVVIAPADPAIARDTVSRGAAQASSSSLDRLLAPIALYPDQLLAQMLVCTGNVAKVAALDEWLRSSGSLKGSELQDAASAAGFEPSFVALAVFPDIVSTMAADAEWTAAIGEAFAKDRSAVFSSIQRLRTQAKSVGSLKSTPQQTVDSRTTSSGQEVIVIEPANPQVVYVPQYNAQTVYTQPTSTTIVVEDDDDDGAAVAAGVIGFTAGIAIGAAIDNDYYHGPYGWGRGAYMYDDAWDDWYDDREDAREDWMDHREDAREDVLDHREDIAEQRGDRAGEAQQQRTERQANRTENRPEAQAAREQRAASGTTAAESRSTSRSGQEARGYSGQRPQATQERSGTRSDAFSGYSSGKSERAASQRGQRSRSSSGGGSRGGGRRR